MKAKEIRQSFYNKHGLVLPDLGNERAENIRYNLISRADESDLKWWVKITKFARKQTDATWYTRNAHKWAFEDYFNEIDKIEKNETGQESDLEFITERKVYSGGFKFFGYLILLEEIKDMAGFYDENAGLEFSYAFILDKRGNLCTGREPRAGDSSYVVAYLKKKEMVSIWKKAA